LSRPATLSPARRKRLAQRVGEAARLQRAGDLVAAEHVLRRVVDSDPRHAPALHALGLIAHRQGRREEAIAWLEQGARGHDADASLHNNLGNMLREAGRNGQAAAAYRAAVAHDPGHLNARFNLAALLLAEGDAEGAREHYEQVCARAPGDVAVRMGLARALLALGRGEEAIGHLAEAMRLAPDDPGCPVLLAKILLGLERLEEATAVAREALARWPADADLLRILADAQMVWEDYEGAERTARALLAVAPGDTDANVELVRALIGQWRLDEAIAASDAFVARRPESADAHGARGIALKQAGRLQEAAQAFERAIELEPEFSAAWSNLGQTWTDLGDLERADECLRRALALDPELPEALFNRLSTRRNGPQHAEEIARVEALSRAGHLTLSDRTSLHFALGKAYDDLGDYDRAFAHFERGNALKRRTVRFVPEKFEQWVQGFHDTFTPELFERLRGSGCASERPVFIVGMPRSGTTLIEQILASHPQVYGADELDTMSVLAESIPSRIGAGLEYPLAAAGLDAGTCTALGREYLEHIATLDPRSARVTDKMPSNYFHLGLIALVLPGARVIHCVRDPMDACFSNFIQFFGTAHYYSYSLEHIAVYYREYARIMRHWHEVLPLAVHEVRYEHLVEDPEAHTRAMLEHLGLAWDDACLAFHRTRRAVRTASHWQVRQPIYRSARQRWRRYAKHLEGLAEQIGYPLSGPA